MVRSGVTCSSLLAALLLMSVGAPTVAASPKSALSAGVARFVLMETTGPVFDVLYKFGQDRAARDGAYGLNVHASPNSWYLEYQRAGGYDVIAGVVRQDPTLIALGLHIVRWGLNREAADGSFPGSESPFHGCAMFLSEVAPGLIMLRDSRYATLYEREMGWQIRRMGRAAHYLMRLAGSPGRVDDSTKNHRYFEAAMAFGAVGILVGDDRLVQWSRRYAWEGITMERSNGVMPEDGGHDSGYQALGMVNASRYLDLLATGALRSSLNRALTRGENWELSRIGADGSVNQAGDTRTSACRERDLAGRCKTVFYAPIYSAFAHWARISGDLRFASAAYLVWERSGYGAGSRPSTHSPGR